MSRGGYIKLHRKIRDNEIFSDPQLLRLWTICLTEATHKEIDQEVGNQIIHLMPGQFITGRYAIAELYNSGLKERFKVKGDKTVFRWLEDLERRKFVTMKKTNKFTVVTVDNWGLYQVEEEKMTTSLTTNKNLKELKDINNIYPSKKGEGDKPMKKSKDKYSEDNQYYQMAVYFKKLQDEYLKELGLSHLTKNSNMQKWADTFRLMVEKDGYPKEDIGKVVHFVTKDEFWRKNILSPDKLRKQYVQLSVKAAEQARSKPNSRKTFSDNNADQIERIKRKALEAREREEKENEGVKRLDGLA